MILENYIPEEGRVIHYTSVDFTSRPIGEPVHLVQYDDGIPIIAVSLYKDGQPYVVPENNLVAIRWGKPDGTFVYNNAIGCNEDRTIIFFEVTVQMVIVPGQIQPVVEITSYDAKVTASGYINVIVNRNPIPHSSIISSNEYLTAAMLAKITIETAKKYYASHELRMEALENHAILDSGYEFPIYEGEDENYILEQISLPELSQLVLGCLFTIGTPFRFGVDEEGNYGYIKEGADTVTPFSSREVDRALLYESLKYSGLVTEDMSYEEMCNILAEHWPESET